MARASLSEAQLHQQIFEYLSWALADNAMVFHCPNGGSRDVREARNLKKLGTTAGIPDLIILYQGRAHFTELKSEKGVISKDQTHTIHRIEDAGCPVYICRSLEDVKAALERWQIPVKEAKPSADRIRRGALNALQEAE